MIEINNLSFGYSRKKLLYKNLRLTLETGNIYGLLGRNGAGKSTLLKNIIGLLYPLEGNISVNGHVPGKRQPNFLETIYFPIQTQAFLLDNLKANFHLLNSSL